MIPPCFTLSIIRYVSRVKWSSPGKRAVPSRRLSCSSYWKGSLLVTLDYSRQLYLLVYIGSIIESECKELRRHHTVINLLILDSAISFRLLNEIANVIVVNRTLQAFTIQYILFLPSKRIAVSNKNNMAFLLSSERFWKSWWQNYILCP